MQSWETIASEFGISVYTASEWCKDIKVAKETVRGTAAQRRSEKETLKQQAIEMENSGMKRAEIARELDVNKGTITRWLG